MHRATILTLAISLQVTMQAVGQDTMPISEAESLIAIYTNDWNLVPTKKTQLIVCIWGDGSIVWSHDQVQGGAPYFKAQLEVANVKSALARLVELGVFEVPKLSEPNFGPDSEFATILVRTSGKELKMNSWHERYELNGKAIASAHGVTGLNGKKLLPALLQEPADYLHYRMTWLELRLAAANLIPKSGVATDGIPEMTGGKLSWRTTKRD